MRDRHRMDGTLARTIRVTGVLDIPEALRLAAALSGIPDDVRVDVDVRSARETHDAAVVALARAIAPRSGAIIGLSRHHAMLLGYVGDLDAGAAP